MSNRAPSARPAWWERIHSGGHHHVVGRRLDDEGMTLVEVLIASTLLVVLLTAVMVTMNLLNGISIQVSTQYAEYDQIVPALAPLQALLRSEVEPAAPSGGLPSPSFTSVGNFNLTFYAAIGTSNNNVDLNGNSAGPAKVVAGEYDSTGAAVVSSSNCVVAAPCSFQVREFLPIVTAGVVVGGSSTCLSFNLPCAYPTAYKLLTDVNDVINNPNQPITPANQTNPAIFSYGVNSGITGDTPYLLTSAQVQAGVSCPGPLNTGVQCPADYIQNVSIDLLVAKPGSGLNGYVQNQTIVYRYARSPGATVYPFQYTGNWG